jgi:hypothetical protein
MGKMPVEGGEIRLTRGAGELSDHSNFDREPKGGNGTGTETALNLSGSAQRTLRNAFCVRLRPLSSRIHAGVYDQCPK